MANEKQVLIDKEPIKKFIEGGLNNPDRKNAFGYDAIQILAEIEFAPTVDAVEVIRCKDCKYCRTFFPIKEIGKEAIQVWFCDLYRCNRKVDEFCSDGERREGE